IMPCGWPSLRRGRPQPPTGVVAQVASVEDDELIRRARALGSQAARVLRRHVCRPLEAPLVRRLAEGDWYTERSRWVRCSDGPLGAEAAQQRFIAAWQDSYDQEWRAPVRRG
ncbi:MAG TPA: hypothetical protein VFA70_14845, partial [Dehalococcoidia bacterium]|nr:hypothetical protein [Dehalococcoidia bacterium]